MPVKKEPRKLRALIALRLFCVLVLYTAPANAFFGNELELTRRWHKDHGQSRAIIFSHSGKQSVAQTYHTALSLGYGYMRVQADKESSFKTLAGAICRGIIWQRKFCFAGELIDFNRAYFIGAKLQGYQYVGPDFRAGMSVGSFLKSESRAPTPYVEITLAHVLR